MNDISYDMFSEKDSGNLRLDGLLLVGFAERKMTWLGQMECGVAAARVGAAKAAAAGDDR
jgi:hypothetical protein